MKFMTIKGPSTACLVEKRSKFIASVAPVSEETEARLFIDEIKSKNPDARHNVFAYLLSDGGQRYSDDGEPQGTGGLPVFGVIYRRGLVNVAAVVTRYFGGVLLGAPGLLRAYSGAATLALDGAEIVVMRRGIYYEIIMEYSLISRVEKLAAELGGRIGDTVYNEKVVMSVMIPEETEAVFLNALTSLSNGAIKPVLKGETMWC